MSIHTFARPGVSAIRVISAGGYETVGDVYVVDKELAYDEYVDKEVFEAIYKSQRNQALKCRYLVYRDICTTEGAPRLLEMRYAAYGAYTGFSCLYSFTRDPAFGRIIPPRQSQYCYLGGKRTRSPMNSVGCQCHGR